MSIISKFPAIIVCIFAFFASVFINEFTSLKYLFLFLGLLAGFFQFKNYLSVIFLGLVWSSFFLISILYGYINGYPLDPYLFIYFVAGPLVAIIMSSNLTNLNVDTVAKILLIICLSILIVNLIYFLNIVFNINLWILEELNVFGGRQISSETIEVRTNSHSALLFYFPVCLCLAVMYDFNSNFWAKLGYITAALGFFILLISGRRALQLITLIPIIYIIYILSFSKSGLIKIAYMLFFGAITIAVLEITLRPLLDGNSFLYSLYVTVFNVFDGDSVSGSVRLKQIFPLIELWSEAPFFGNGANAYNLSYIRNHDLPWSYEWTYLAWLGQIGIFGVLLFICLILTIIYGSHGSKRLKGNSALLRKSVNVGGICFLISAGSNPMIYFLWFWVFFIYVNVMLPRSFVNNV